MRRYEMVLVADPMVSEPDHDQKITNIENLIAELGGVVHKVDRWGRMKLAFPVRKNTEGNYTLLLFDGEPAVEKELIRRIKLTDEFMRFLSVRADHEKPPTTEEQEALAEARKEHLRKAAERPATAEASDDDEAADESGEAAESAEPTAEKAPSDEAPAPAEEAPAETAKEETE